MYTYSLQTIPNQFYYVKYNFLEKKISNNPICIFTSYYCIAVLFLL